MALFIFSLTSISWWLFFFIIFICLSFLLFPLFILSTILLKSSASSLSLFSNWILFNPSLISKILKFKSSNNPQLYAIDLAVSFLSPVNTQSLIPASEKSFKVSFTSSCNSSIILANSFSFSFFLYVFLDALIKSFWYFINSSNVNFL